MIMTYMLKFPLIVVAALSLLTACETTTIAAGNAAQSSQSERITSEYILGAGDKLRVTVFGEDDISGEFTVNSSGLVSLPLIGEVSASGKTVRGFQTAVETALRDGYLKDPRVAAEVLNYRPYYILGEVALSGEYPYSSDLTVLNAIATAGGFTYRANKKYVFIKRAGEQTEIRYPLTVSTPVQPGDTIRIAERLF